MRVTVPPIDKGIRVPGRLKIEVPPTCQRDKTPDFFYNLVGSVWVTLQKYKVFRSRMDPKELKS